MKHFALTLPLTLMACASGGPDILETRQAEVEALSPEYITRQGSQFMKAGKPVRFVGANRYDLAGGPLANQCKHGNSNAWLTWQNTFIEEAAAADITLIRLWAFQNFAGPTGKDFSAFDAVVAAAKKHGIHLVLTLENNWGDCSQGGIKDDAWFTSGYKGNYGYALAFPDYVTALVEHFKDEPTVAMWQIINEGKWYQQPTLLRNFFINVAQLIKSLDKNHLVSSGGAIQCWQGKQGVTDFQSFYDDASIDVLDAHDYGDETAPWPTCIAAAAQVGKNLHKPLMIGESGISTAQFAAPARAAYFSAKMETAAHQGVDAYVIWSMNYAPAYTDNFDFFAGDPTAKVVSVAASTWFSTAKTPTPLPTPTPSPTPSPSPSPIPTPTPAPTPLAGCKLQIPANNPWAVGANLWNTSVTLNVSAQGPQGVTVPWTLLIDSDSVLSVPQSWNWQVTNPSPGQVRGTMTQAWGALLPNGGNSVSVGAVFEITAPQFLVQRATLNGRTCTVEQMS